MQTLNNTLKTNKSALKLPDRTCLARHSPRNAMSRGIKSIRTYQPCLALTRPPKWAQRCPAGPASSPPTCSLRARAGRRGSASAPARAPAG
eukprot:scaffold132632_cov78-Phaeocystis_antarctica.AAC.1